MASLQKEANPFQIQALKTWLTASDNHQSVPGPQSARPNIPELVDEERSRSRATTFASVSTTEDSTICQSVDEDSNLTSFWVIPSSQLQLKRKVPCVFMHCKYAVCVTTIYPINVQVAAGAAGNVFLAEYQGFAVAAKQLTSLSDLASNDDSALRELVNEVRVINLSFFKARCFGSSLDDTPSGCNIGTT